MELNEARDDGVTKASDGKSFALHSRQSRQQLIILFLQARCSSIGPTNNVKAVASQRTITIVNSSADFPSVL